MNLVHKYQLSDFAFKSNIQRYTQITMYETVPFSTRTKLIDPENLA